MNIRLVPLVLILALLLSACTVAQNAVQTTDPGYYVDTGTYSFTDYAEYEQHIQQKRREGKLPSDFVSASAFSILGDLCISCLYLVCHFYIPTESNEGIQEFSVFSKMPYLLSH